MALTNAWLYNNNGSILLLDTSDIGRSPSISFKEITVKLEEKGVTDLVGYTGVKGSTIIDTEPLSENTVGKYMNAYGDLLFYTIQQSDLPVIPPQNYKELVQKTADAYRKKSGTTAQVSVGELPDKIRSLKVEGGVPPNGREWKQSNINTGTFTHICCGENGVWVAGGKSDLYYSLDGIDWTSIGLTDHECTALYYANGKFVAGLIDSRYYGGYIKYSNDGIHWEKTNMVPHDSSPHITSIKNDGRSWFAGGPTGVFYSLDGKTWKKTGMNFAVETICCTDIGVSVCSTKVNGIVYFYGDELWSESNINTERVLSIIYADGMFVAGTQGSGIYYSTDGITWKQSNITTMSFSILTYGKGIYIAGASSYTGIYYSTDGITWKQSNAKVDPIISLVYNNGIFIAGRGDAYGTYYSIDGKSWILDESINKEFNQISYANGIWVAGTGNGLYYSLASFDRSPAPEPVEDTSWATASEGKITSMLAEARAGKINLEDYWKVGDTRKITLDNKSYSGSAGSMTTSNEEVELVLAEPLSVSTSYGAKNGFIVTTKNCLKTEMMMNLNGTNTGSFAGSDMCAFLNDSANGFLGMLPDWLANNLLTANVKTADPYDGTTIKTTQHKIFLPTEREIFGAGCEGNGYSNNTEAKLAELKHWKYYQTTSNRVKQVNGRDSYWWERSPNGYHSNLFCVVRSYGIAYVNDANVPSGVAPCFCIGTPQPKSITASVSTVSGTSYGFAKNSNGYFESQNKGYHSTAALCKLTITVTGSYNVSLDCINYAETNYDFGLISTKNGTLSTSYTEDSNVLKSFKGLSQSDVQNVSLGTLKDETATFYIKFRKDGSGNSYNDSLQWKLKADGNIVDVAE